MKGQSGLPSINKIEKVVRSSRVIVHSGRYAYLESSGKVLGPHFMIAQDQDEITVITEERNLSKVKYSGLVKWFKLIEIKVSVPFFPGFLSRVIKPIAEAGFNTLIVSTFSKDYLLVREENHQDIVEILERLGFTVS